MFRTKLIEDFPILAKTFDVIFHEYIHPYEIS